MAAISNIRFAFALCINSLDRVYLGECIDSLISQDYDNFEVHILLNSRSIVTNNLIETFLLDRVSCHHNIPFYIYKSRIESLGNSLNILIDRITADYIVRMDADDQCTNDRLEKLSMLIKDYPGCAVYSSQVEFIDSHSNPIKTSSLPISDRHIKKLLHVKTCFIHPATCLQRDALLQVGGYRNYNRSEDLDLWIRLREAGFSFQGSNDICLKYRIHNSQMSSCFSSYLYPFLIVIHNMFDSGPKLWHLEAYLLSSLRLLIYAFRRITYGHLE